MSDKPYPTVLELEKRIADLEREARQHWHLMPSPLRDHVLIHLAALRAELAATKYSDDHHVRDLEACYKVQEGLRAELAAERERCRDLAVAVQEYGQQRDTARERCAVLEGLLDRWLHSGFGIAPPINETKAALAGKD